jgi:hypothetical protein
VFLVGQLLELAYVERVGGGFEDGEGLGRDEEVVVSECQALFVCIVKGGLVIRYFDPIVAGEGGVGYG